MKIEIKKLARQSLGEFLDQHGLSLQFIEEDLGRRWAAGVAAISTANGLMRPIRDNAALSLLAVGSTAFEALAGLAEQLSNKWLLLPIKAFAQNPDLDLTRDYNWYQVHTPVFEITDDILVPLHRRLRPKKNSKVMDGPSA